jgi:hypothetical protein
MSRLQRDAGKPTIDDLPDFCGLHAIGFELQMEAQRQDIVVTSYSHGF